jgi:U3 small nucleolar RNA-associated protein 15
MLLEVKPLHFTNTQAEIYAPILGQSPTIDALFLRLKTKVAAEIRFQRELLKTKGALDMVISALNVPSVN